VIAPVHRYHDGTKHYFHRFARSLGFLDWASQPNPFRAFAGVETIPLSPQPAAPVTVIGDVLRHSLGLSAWKQFGASRWALRVNPSSGNLHPTEAYVVAGETPGAGGTAGVFHYAPDRHALERRCAFGEAAWQAAVADPRDWLMVLTSIHWREAWKYGERAFRYCQHDMGHAIAAVGMAAAAAGWRATLLPDWSHADIAALAGLDRDEDYVEAEREEAGCVLAMSRRSSVVSTESPVVSRVVGREALLAGVRAGRWTGTASQLSEDHTTWTFIDEIAAATRDPGRSASSIPPIPPIPPIQLPNHPITQLPDAALILQRRSAVAFDGVSTIGRDRFLAMLARVMPQAAPPWDALWWDARVHLAIFVHRVDGLAPGLYLLARDRGAVDRLRVASRRDFLWQPADGTLPLFTLALGDCRALARRLSCDQDIAADSFFSLGMIAEFDASLQAWGPSFYRQLFWESGVVGQVLYLEAEAAGARATGIGCFYDDPVHEVLGIADHSFQSLYHFTVGNPVEDTRLTTSAGYPWEAKS
jgi:SagB-type dehydrogenase family enzyme